MANKEELKIEFTVRYGYMTLNYEVEVKTREEVSRADTVFFITSLENFIQDWYDQYTAYVKDDSKDTTEEN